MKYSSNPFIIVVSNPLDAMVYLAKEVSKLPASRIVGMAGVLDSARFRTFVALELKCSLVDVDAMVLGGHGDSMVPMPRYTTVSGISITDLLSAEKIASLVERTRKGGAEIVGLLKKGSAFLAPGASVVKMIEAVLRDKKRTFPCTAYLDGQYGWKGIFMGVPVKLGEGGAETIIELKLTPEEKIALDNSAKDVKKMIDEVDAFLASCAEGE